MLWLSTKRNNCDSNYATFRLPWVHSLHFPSKNFFLYFRCPSRIRISSFFQWKFFKWTAKWANPQYLSDNILKKHKYHFWHYSWFQPLCLKDSAEMIVCNALKDSQEKIVCNALKDSQEKIVCNALKDLQEKTVPNVLT